jgi:Polyketide cyclase / dehydrase and lipid transport
MARVHAEASAAVNAPPEAVYAVLSDYKDTKQGHQAILPDKNFKDFRVEQGGVGAGTVISFASVVGGAEKKFHMRIEEPERGHVLLERDLDSNTVTTFSVKPAKGGRSLVTIATDFEGSGGIRGFIEKMAAPGMLRKVYEAELQKLEQVAASRKG